MKIFKRILLGLVVLLLLGCGGSYLFLQSLKPDLRGDLAFSGIKEEIQVYYDKFGIPHIYAQSEEDAQFALGYVHAQDRLFQMEMLRRVGKGTLAEILGPDLAKTDRFFRTIGIRETAKKAAAAFHQLPDNDPVKKATLAYYAGVNTYINHGDKPVEFYLLGIPKEPFTIEDCYAIFGYMAFTFAHAIRTDPLITRIQQQLGPAYMKDLDVHWNPQAEMIPTFPRPKADTLISGDFTIDKLFNTLPVPPWLGSNSWVIGPGKTESGKVILANDTHMKFAQPSVWYEAHLEGPGFSRYGNYLGGIPFAVTGHNRKIAWGLTMFENDDIDFYQEQRHPDHPNQVKFEEQWETTTTREEVVKVKDGDDLIFEVQSTRHGPIVNEAIDNIGDMTAAPVSMWWVYNEFVPQTLQALYQINHSASLEDMRKAVALGHAPGLNVMYGDVEGNIAWWTMAKLPKRPPHVNSKVFLDGSSGKDEILGYFDFEDNPHAENPPTGYVYSANNQPDSLAGVLHAGYYIPQDRASRITDLLESDDEWTLEKVKMMVTDVKSAEYPEVAQNIIAALEDVELRPNEEAAKALLANWDGEHHLNDSEPTIFYKLLYLVLERTFQDELGEADFGTLLRTHMLKRTFPFLFEKLDSPWWDDITTDELAETRRDIFLMAFRQAIAELEVQLGSEIDQWQWHKVHTIEHPHALAKVPALASIFNVGPLPVNGGNEVINNMLFTLNETGQYPVTAGPAKRRVIDFSDLEHSYSVLPTGQSGNVLSPHYDDQAQMFVAGDFRLQLMNKEEIAEEAKGNLILRPQK